ncbi:AraC family transcriptional regulator [Abyssisolibacter fermentans]|uniref:AraC family transcriptional regulator n=1 Tax=Abyssisolibacter fermentans TaxID=1766203 RepID=UPI001FA7A149|nr:AraC family transcriptional regulator [Abyssisolibacter fermentans]
MEGMINVDWLKRMNAAIDYIEDNITCDIDYKELAKIACCPNYHFQRMFSFITEIPLSEYIRRRRLTLAAFELQQNHCSVIEIAQKYGYTSHSAFTRAFNELHGIAPTSARKSGAKLKAYPRMSFHFSIVGGSEMNYRFEKIDSFSAVGFKYNVNTEKAFNTVPMIWQEVQQNGFSERLLSLMDTNEEKSLNGVFGILSDGDWGKKKDFSYYLAVPYKKETPVGMEKLTFPESQWVVFEASNLTDIVKAWKRLYTDWVPTSNYFLADLPAIECYYPPGHNPQNEIWIPIVKKN